MARDMLLTRGEEAEMAAEPRVRRNAQVLPGHVETTLLQLVQLVSEVARDDREVVATVRELLRSGRVKLTGNFRDNPPMH
jgi:hypothetical protein